MVMAVCNKVFCLVFRSLAPSAVSLWQAVSLSYKEDNITGPLKFLKLKFRDILKYARVRSLGIFLSKLSLQILFWALDLGKEETKEGDEYQKDHQK